MYEHNDWFNSLQDDLYSWFMSDDIGGLEGFGGASSHAKYILDNGDYSHLLVDMDGNIEKISLAFELNAPIVVGSDGEGVSEYFDLNEEEIRTRIAHLDEKVELVRILPAKSSYDFPIRDENNSEINELYLAMADDVTASSFSEIFSELSEEDGVTDIASKEKFKTIMMKKLSQQLVSFYYQFSWDDEIVEHGSIKDAFENFMKQGVPPLCKHFISETIEEMLNQESDDDSETLDKKAINYGLDIDASEEVEAIKNIQVDSREAYIAACAIVMVCDNELNENELLELYKTSLKSELMVTLAESIGLEDLGDSETDDKPEELNMETTQEIANNIKKAWEATRSNDSEYELIDLIAEKIGNGLSPFVLASCLDTAASDGRLQEEERFVLARFATKWAQEDELCNILHSITNKTWEILTVADKQILVLSSDIGVQEETQDGLSVLWQALENKDVERIMELIAEGESVNVVLDMDGELQGITPLMVVAEQFGPEICQVFIDAGADVNASASRGYCPITWALKGNRVDNFKLLMEAGANPDPLEDGDDGFSPLSMAAKHGLNEAVQELLKKHVNINWTNDSGHTALREAVNSGHNFCVQMLLQAGAIPSTYDSDGFSPIHNAASSGYKDIVKMLLDAGVDVDFPFSDSAENAGETALNSACWFGHMEVIKTLVERGADVVNHGDPVDDVVGGAAERTEDPFKMAKYLISKGALTSFQAILMAQLSMSVPTFELLFNRIAKRKEPLTSDQLEACKEALTNVVAMEEDEERRMQVINVINSAGEQWQLKGI